MLPRFKEPVEFVFQHGLIPRTFLFSSFQDMDQREAERIYESSVKLCLHNQAEIRTAVRGEKFVPKHDLDHMFYLPTAFRVGRSLTENEDSFYDSFSQGLRHIGLRVTLDELKHICKPFEDWFKSAIDKYYSHTKNVDKESLREFSKIFFIRFLSWILCINYNVKLYLIEKQILDVEHRYRTHIIDKVRGSVCLKGAFFLVGTSMLTIVNLGGGHYEPLVENIVYDEDNRIIDLENIPQGIIVPAVNSTSDPILEIINIINDLRKPILNENIKEFDETVRHLRKMDRNSLKMASQDPRNIFKDTNLLILACQHNLLDLAKYIITDKNILQQLSFNVTIETYNKKEEAILYAILNKNIDLLEMLYDHLFVDLHWSCSHQNKGAVNILKELNAILTKMCLNYSNQICEDFQMFIDVNCLIEVGRFRIELYTELGKINYDYSNSNDVRKAKTEAAIATMLTVLRTYEKYNLKDIRRPHNVPRLDVRLRNLFADHTSNYVKSYNELLYNMYYKKLDHNVSLLILDNLYYLQHRIKLSSVEYNTIEAAVYTFMIMVRDEWILYIPKPRPKRKIELLVDTYDTRDKFRFSLTFDANKHSISLILYFSRKKFSSALCRFRTALENALDDVGAYKVRDQSIRQEGIKLPKEEINRLTSVPVLRNYYSLANIKSYLEWINVVDLENDKEFSILILERIIQVVGELFKTSEESFHLDSLTISLLELEVPSDIIQTFRDLRDYISHSNKAAQLLRRIHVATSECDYYNNVLKDLIELKNKIKKVTYLYEPILNKWKTETVLSLLEIEENNIPISVLDDCKTYLNATIIFLRSPKKYLKYENKLVKEYKLTRQRLREIVQIHNTLKEQLFHQDRKIFLEFFNDNNERVLESIDEKLRLITQNNTNECKKEWEFIINLFEYILETGQFLKYNEYEYKYKAYSKMFESIRNRISNDNAVWNANNILSAIKKQSRPGQSSTSNAVITQPGYEFAGIKTLNNTYLNLRFITDDEKKYILDDFKKSHGSEADKVMKENRKIFQKLQDGVPIEGSNIKKLCSLKFSVESKNIINYLNMGAQDYRDSKLNYCFENRVDLLKRLLGDENNSVADIAFRYIRDVKFQFALKMILIDIMNLLTFIKQNLKKHKNMYTDANLRHVLSHTEPLLATIGWYLDPYDLATALAEKALECLQNEDVWKEALDTVKLIKKPKKKQKQ